MSREKGKENIKMQNKQRTGKCQALMHRRRILQKEKKCEKIISK